MAKPMTLYNEDKEGPFCYLIYQVMKCMYVAVSHNALKILIAHPKLKPAQFWYFSFSSPLLKGTIPNIDCQYLSKSVEHFDDSFNE